jgi:hypothetical protein
MSSLKKIDFTLRSLYTRLSYLRLRCVEHMALNIEKVRASLMGDVISNRQIDKIAF